MLSDFWTHFWYVLGYRRCCVCGKLKLRDRMHARGRVNIRGAADDPVCKLCTLSRGKELDEYNATAAAYLRKVH